MTGKKQLWAFAGFAGGLISVDRLWQSPGNSSTVWRRLSIRAARAASRGFSLVQELVMAEINETISSIAEKSTKIVEKLYSERLTSIIEKLYGAIGLGAGVALAILLLYHHAELGGSYIGPFFTFLHVVSGITWIGLLYYFNLVQIPTMPKIPAELKPGIGQYIAPEALFWFRWSALATVITGLLVLVSGWAQINFTLMTGMILGLIMAFNVWFIIWPNQQKALGLVPADDETKARSARLAMLTSRLNFVLSIPMLYCMVTPRYFP
jgi:hypothetical protein